MVPFNSVTQTLEEAEVIISKQRKLLEKLTIEGAISEGLRAQYELVLRAYESGKAGNCELITYPGLLIPGSEYSSHPWIGLVTYAI